VREADSSVVVKALYYQSDGDTAYENVPTNYRGETESTKLLGQIMDYAPRNEWIGTTLFELTDNPKRRILILSQYKRHLEAFEELLQKHRPNVTYSYYVGGMKEEVREKGAQTSQVLLGSYAMASEAMNIKTLNTVILASPRKKIEQSVGRILRQRPNEREVHPLIVDVVDSHGTFRRQFVKRRAFYTQCGYKIERVFRKKETQDPENEDSDSDTEQTPKATKKPVFELVDDD
jgi:superfamily II DNA or RNA helicase